MCDGCNRRGLVALEAIANGEEIPEIPDGAEVVQPKFSLPFPVLIQVTENGLAAIITTEIGWQSIQGFLESIGRPIEDD